MEQERPNITVSPEVMTTLKVEAKKRGVSVGTLLAQVFSVDQAIRREAENNEIVIKKSNGEYKKLILT